MEETKQTTTTTTEATGNIEPTASLIDRADGVAKRMEEANRKAEELLTRQEQIAARLMLSGKSSAGSVTKTPEEINKEEVERQIKARLSRF